MVPAMTAREEKGVAPARPVIGGRRAASAAARGKSGAAGTMEIGSERDGLAVRVAGAPTEVAVHGVTPGLRSAGRRAKVVTNVTTAADVVARAEITPVVSELPAPGE
jgi:hypothetical protein